MNSRGFIIWITIAIGVVVLALILSPKERPFCTSEDDLYKTISAHAIEWDTYFFHSSQSTATTHVYFSIGDGEEFTAIKMDATEEFFVVADYDYPHSYLGARGYMFSSNGIPGDWSEYRYSKIGDNLYCYELE